MDWIAPLEKGAAHDTLEIAFGEFANPSFADPNRQISASKNRPGIFWLLCFCFASWLWPLRQFCRRWRTTLLRMKRASGARARSRPTPSPRTRSSPTPWYCARRGGALLWLKHRDFIPAPARQRLEKLLEFSIQGCLRHKVHPAYSNIAIMNAGDLILPGEAMGRPEVAAEGYARLDQVFRYTQAAGIHEFDSPTYTGVDLDGLGMIEAFCRRDAGRPETERGKSRRI